MKLTGQGLRSGIWRGHLTGWPGPTPPTLRAFGPDGPLPDPVVQPSGEGAWDVSLTLAPDQITDGIRVFWLESSEGARLATFSITAGTPEGDAIAEELALLRAELDLLKAVLRRHIAGSH